MQAVKVVSDYPGQVIPVVNFIQWNIEQNGRFMTLEPMITRNLQTKLLESYNIASSIDTALQISMGRIA